MYKHLVRNIDTVCGARNCLVSNTVWYLKVTDKFIILTGLLARRSPNADPIVLDRFLQVHIAHGPVEGGLLGHLRRCMRLHVIGDVLGSTWNSPKSYIEDLNLLWALTLKQPFYLLNPATPKPKTLTQNAFEVAASFFSTLVTRSCSTAGESKVCKHVVWEDCPSCLDTFETRNPELKYKAACKGQRYECWNKTT